MVTPPWIDDIRRISDGDGLSLVNRLRNQSLDDKENNNNSNNPVTSVAQDVDQPLFSTICPPTLVPNSTLFRSTLRSLAEIATRKPVICKEDLPTNKKDLQKLREFTTTKLCNSFGFLSPDDTDSQLANIYDISMRIVEFAKMLSWYEMIDIFTLRLDSSTSASEKIPSFFSSITKQEVRDSNRFYILYGQDYDIQNLYWFQNFEGLLWTRSAR